MADLQNILNSIHELSREDILVLRKELERELQVGGDSNGKCSRRTDLIGLFADDGDILDGVLESVYENRNQPLRAE